ncbi:MAG: response regulator [Eubacteriales bacterium]
MVLLLVDDQQSVLDGILAGVDWKALGSPEVLTANSALQAKEWFQAQAVDILVCDIEMPIENGLELFRWVRTIPAPKGSSSPPTRCSTTPRPP